MLQLLYYLKGFKMLKTELKAIKAIENNKFYVESKSIKSRLLILMDIEDQNCEHIQNPLDGGVFLRVATKKWTLLSDLYYANYTISNTQSLLKKIKQITKLDQNIDKDFITSATIIFNKFSEINENLNSIEITKNKRVITDFEKYYATINTQYDKKLEFAEFAKSLKSNFEINKVKDDEDITITINGNTHKAIGLEIGVKIGDGNRLHYAVIRSVITNENGSKSVLLNRGDYRFTESDLFIVNLWEHIPKHLKAYGITKVIL